LKPGRLLSIPEQKMSDCRVKSIRIGLYVQVLYGINSNESEQREIQTAVFWDREVVFHLPPATCHENNASTKSVPCRGNLHISGVGYLVGKSGDISHKDMSQNCCKKCSAKVSKLLHKNGKHERRGKIHYTGLSLRDPMQVWIKSPPRFALPC